MVVLSDLLSQGVVADRVVGALVDHALVAAADQTATGLIAAVPRTTQLHGATFGRPKTGTNLVRIGLRHPQLTDVISLRSWSNILRIMILRISINIPTFVVISQTLDI